jgi:hypothetical protein
MSDINPYAPPLAPTAVDRNSMDAAGLAEPLYFAVSSIFYTHELFRRIRKDAELYNVTTDGDPSSRATAYVALTVLMNIASRIASGAVFLAPLAVIPLTLEVREINAVVRQSSPEADLNERFTAVNILWIVFGVVLWLLMLVGLAVESRTG